jgi:chemotaxis protein MotB
MNDEPAPIMIPEWVVTFGDMMSLLLTFFIMLVSMSEIKQEDKFQALVDSMREQFGYTLSPDSLAPGDVKARTSAFSVMSTMGRAKKKNTAKGGVPEKAPVGEEPMVRIIRPGRVTAIGSVIFFSPASAELDNAAKKALDITAEEFRGKPQKIEVRGHCAAEITARTAGTNTGITLAYDRAIAVMEYLSQEKEIPTSRFRVSTAGDSEPLIVGDANAVSRNSRVELFLLDETVDALRGDESSRPDGLLPQDQTEEKENG